MRIPSNYCPNCKRFKKWYQVTNVDANDFGNCKHCGTKCIYTEKILKDYVEKIIRGDKNE